APPHPRGRPAQPPPLAPQAHGPTAGLEAGHRPRRVHHRGPRARRQPCRPPSPPRPTVTPPPLKPDGKEGTVTLLVVALTSTSTRTGTTRSQLRPVRRRVSDGFGVACWGTRRAC